MKPKSIKNVDWPAKTRVIVRVDFNLPLGPLGDIRDDFRLRQTLPTLEYLLERQCSLVLISHLGRPGGRVEPSLSLAPVVHRLRELLPETIIRFCDDWTGPAARQASRRLRPGQILLLENIRFHPGEESAEPEFVRQLAHWGRVLVNDCFGAAQRASASTVGLAGRLPAVAGLLVDSELTTLAEAGQPPRRPCGVILGGAKVADKLDLLEAFVDRADFIAASGRLAVHFAAARGWGVGASRVEPASLDRAREILTRLESRPEVELFLPLDYIVADAAEPPASRPVSLAGQTLGSLAPGGSAIAPDESMIDIGPAAAAYIVGRIQSLKTVIWNGTAGIAETSAGSHGSRLLADGLAAAERPTTVVGGGDTLAYLDRAQPHLKDRFDLISTGGGASLTYLAGRPLPAIEALWPESKRLKLAPQPEES